MKITKKLKASDKYLNARSTRKYFENGCLCILENKIKLQITDDDQLAADYYWSNCKCSRHPKSASRVSWDSLLTTKERKDLLEKHMK